jgi:TRAP-type C4-dicarboxylate transport system permease large subunit
MAVALVSRSLKWEGIKNSLIDTTKTTAMIMLIVAGAMIFGRFIAISRIPFELATWAGQIPLPPSAAVGLILLICLILGCFIDALALVLLTVPIFYPVVVDTLGYDPIWFGVIVVLVVAMGVITPPVGMNVFVIKGVVPDIPLEVIYKGIWPFLLVIMIAIGILMVFPGIATFLPALLMP